MNNDDPPCGHMLRGIRKAYCARCQRAAYPAPTAAQAPQPVAIRVREIFPQGAGRWRYFDFDPTMDLNRPNEEVEVLTSAEPAQPVAAPAQAVAELQPELIEMLADDSYDHFHARADARDSDLMVHFARSIEARVRQQFAAAQPAAAGASASDAARLALSDVDPVVLECWKLQGRTVGAMLDDAQADVIELQDKLREIGDYAHDRSTGPAVPDALWEVRSMAYAAARGDSNDAPEDRARQLAQAARKADAGGAA